MDVKISYKAKKACRKVDESISNDILVKTVRKTGSYTDKVIDRVPTN